MVLYSGAVQLQAGRGLKLARLSAFISPYLVKFMKHNKSNTAFLYEIAIIFSAIYWTEATHVINSFNLMTDL